MPYSPKTMKILTLLTILAYIIVSSPHISQPVDFISLSHSITDGMTIVSKDKTFELGFFSPGNSKKRYVGIWYHNIPIQTVVWVANRASPINDSSGILILNRTGNLVLTHNNIVVWYTTCEKQAQNPVTQLLDSGNLVVRDENEENLEGYLWQSFDYPSDTLLPGMKMGWDRRNGFDWNLTSWKSPDDPAPGDFSYSLSHTNYPEFYMMKGSEIYYGTGPWNGLHFSGLPAPPPNPILDFIFISSKDEAYLTYNLKNKSVITRIVMNQTTYLQQRFVWVEAERIWKLQRAFPSDYCDNYGLCGVYGTCIITDYPVCKCLKGFKPKSPPQAWDSLDWSQGCVRDKPLGCMNNSRDDFIKLRGLKLPDATNTLVDETISLEECKIKCLNNCSCVAYTNSDVRGTGSGCAIWFGDLIDVKESSTGQDLYIRMAASEFEAKQGHKKSTIISATVISAISGILLFGSYYIYKACGKVDAKSKKLALDINNDEEDVDPPLFDLSTIAIATDNFSNLNKIGEGGFGVVYKGKLVNGLEIAVKRLSESSRQGMIEFKNEVKLIAKLQHRNLVKLLGCCIQVEEKMLIYEYMPNASLDCFIFDHIRGKLLDWPKRFNIICGIASGLLYLHQDSRLRIIHRDLKASNVLLDDKLNPKISDFGLAKIFEGDQIEGSTKRIVGTFGYMAPEYAVNGLFSMKSDVFSFGILLLEIICGQRNRGFYHLDYSLNLIGYAWKMWKEEKALELVDTNMRNSCVVTEVLCCIHVSLLCVQQFPENRPTMSSVVPMLVGENELVEPKQPAFFLRKDITEANSSSNHKEVGSINEMTITMFEAR